MAGKLAVDRMSEPALWSRLDQRLLELQRDQWTGRTPWKVRDAVLSECRDIVRELRLRGVQLSLLP